MTIFTIDANDITIHATPEEAQAVPNAQRITSAKKLAALTADWPAARLVELWNSIPGNTRIRKFTDRNSAVTRIWKAIQTFGETYALADRASAPAAESVRIEEAQAPAQEPPAVEVEATEPRRKKRQTKTTAVAPPANQEAPATTAQPAPEPPALKPHVKQKAAEPVSEEVRPETPAGHTEANVGEQAPNVAPAEAAAARKPTRKKNAPTGEKTARAPREKSKTSRVIEMLRREGGTTLEEIMTTMGWQKHTTRAMLSAGGSLRKKHGLVVVSEKIGDRRIYSIQA